MSLGWDTLAALPAFRVQAESRMSETVTVGRSTPNGLNPETLEPVADSFVLHYPTPQDIFTDVFRDVFGDAGNGRARIKYSSLTVSESSTLGQVLAAQDAVLSLPVGMGLGVRIDDIVTVTASTVDPALIGRRFRVKGSAQAGQVTASRFPLEEVS